MPMDGGDACRPRVEIAAALPIAVLHRAISELDFAAIPNRPAASTRAVPSLKDRAGKTGFAQLISGDKAGDPPPRMTTFFPLPKSPASCGSVEIPGAAISPRARIVL